MAVNPGHRSAASDAGAARFRPLPVGGSLAARFDAHVDGSLRVHSAEPLRDYPARLTDRLLHWAAAAPQRTLAARRGADGRWRHLSYAEALRRARSIAQALIDLGLSVERPLAIVSENDLEHLQLGLGAMLAGAKGTPVSPAYSTISQDFGKLHHVATVLTPGLVFASSARAWGRAIGAAVPDDVPVVLTEGAVEGRRCIARSEEHTSE